MPLSYGESHRVFERSAERLRTFPPTRASGNLSNPNRLDTHTHPDALPHLHPLPDRHTLSHLHPLPHLHQGLAHIHPYSQPYFAIYPQTIGPVWDTLHNTSYSVEVSLTNVRWLERGIHREPKTGNTFVIMDLVVKNLGPGPINNFGPRFFRVLDANSVLKEDDYTSDVEDCRVDYVDLMPNGVLSGCLLFEVLQSGHLELIFAPYQYEPLKPGRYLSFILRP